MHTMFPKEIVENILYYCDGYTLYNVYDVNTVWRSSLEYITQRTNVWEQCCRTDIPAHELVHYLHRYNDYRQHEHRWHRIYDNWYNWADIKRNIRFDIVPVPVEVVRITCIDMLNGHLAVGSEDGKVHVFNRHWKRIYSYRSMSVRVTSIDLLFDENHSYDEYYPTLVIGYKNGSVIVTECDNKMNNCHIYDVKLHSVHKQYICFVKLGGRISICQYRFDPKQNQNTLFEITYARIYSPNEISNVQMLESTCTFIMNDSIKVINYRDDKVAPFSSVTDKCALSSAKRFLQDTNFTILRDDIVVSLCTACPLQQTLDIFILNEKNISSHLTFKVYEVFHADITCMYLHGNTFVLGSNTGVVYLYDIHSWKLFNLPRYREKVIVGQHPIISIAVHESKNERNFFVSSTFSIHRLIGFTPSPKMVVTALIPNPN